jgi:uncharacterized Zn-binding protein involved in type VI secretion
MPTLIRLGDPGSHGGTMITATGNFTDDGIQVCVNGDTYHCNVHGNQTVTASFSGFSANGKAVLVDGDTAACGATIGPGSPDTTAY